MLRSTLTRRGAFPPPLMGQPSAGGARLGWTAATDRARRDGSRACIPVCPDAPAPHARRPACAVGRGGCRDRVDAEIVGSSASVHPIAPVLVVGRADALQQAIDDQVSQPPE